MLYSVYIVESALSDLLILIYRIKKQFYQNNKAQSFPKIVKQFVFSSNFEIAIFLQFLSNKDVFDNVF